MKDSATTELTLDLDELTRFYGEGSVEFIHEILQLFMQDTQHKLQQIDTLLNQEPCSVMASHRLVHSLKSGCRMSGALAMAESASQLEQLLKSGQVVEARYYYPDLLRFWGQFKQAAGRHGVCISND